MVSVDMCGSNARVFLVVVVVVVAAAAAAVVVVVQYLTVYSPKWQ